jgi:hypothetical protein
MNGVFNGVVGGCLVDVVVKSPVFILFVKVEILAVDGGDKGKNFSFRISACGRDLVFEEARYGADVFHNKLGLLENVFVDLLKRVKVGFVAFAAGYTLSGVDMSRVYGLGLCGSSLVLKFREYGKNFGIHERYLPFIMLY